MNTTTHNKVVASKTNGTKLSELRMCPPAWKTFFANTSFTIGDVVGKAITEEDIRNTGCALCTQDILNWLELVKFFRNIRTEYTPTPTYNNNSGVTNTYFPEYDQRNPNYDFKG